MRNILSLLTLALLGGILATKMKSSHKSVQATLVASLLLSLLITGGLAYCALLIPAFQVAPAVQFAIVALFAGTLAACSLIFGAHYARRRWALPEGRSVRTGPLARA